MIRRATATAEDEQLEPPAPRARIPLLIVPHGDPQLAELAQRAQQAESELKRAEAEIDALKTQRTMLAITTIGGPLLVWIAMRNRAAPPAPPQQQAKP